MIRAVQFPCDPADKGEGQKSGRPFAELGPSGEPSNGRTSLQMVSVYRRSTLWDLLFLITSLKEGGGGSVPQTRLAGAPVSRAELTITEGRNLKARREEVRTSLALLGPKTHPVNSNKTEPPQTPPADARSCKSPRLARS